MIHESETQANSLTLERQNSGPIFNGPYRTWKAESGYRT